MLASVSCDWETVKNVVTGNSSSKPDRTLRDGKFVSQKCLITLHIVGWVINSTVVYNLHVHVHADIPNVGTEWNEDPQLGAEDSSLWESRFRFRHQIQQGASLI